MTAKPRVRDEFFAALHRGGRFSYYWTLETKESDWWDVDTPSPLPDRDQRDKGKYNIYFGVHPTGTVRGRHERASVADIMAVNCFFADFDAKRFGGKEAALAHIRALPFPPSVIIDSGGGYHCYWIFVNTFPIATEDDRARIRDAQRAWVDFVGSDGGAKDLARVLRVPGTKNYKREYAPDFPDVLIQDGADVNRRYDFEALETAALNKGQGVASPLADGAGLRDDGSLNGGGEHHRNGNGAAPVDTTERPIDDQTLIEKALNASNGKTFHALFVRGDTGQHGSDASAADLALCNLLAFWTNRDAARMDRLFRQSALMRPKWDEVHYADGKTYGQATIQRAIAGTTNGYDPLHGSNGARPPAPGTGDDGQEAAIENPPSLGHLRSIVGELNRSTSRAVKELVGQHITRYFHRRGGLLLDTETDTPYLVSDTGAILQINLQNLRTAAEIASTGLNWSEATFRWVVADLQTATIRQGRRVALARWSTYRDDGTLYTSCGPDRLIIARHGEPLLVAPNGADGVLFAGDAVFPEWRPAAPIDPFDLHALNNVNFEAPSGVPDYGGDAQRALLLGLLVSILTMRPVPIGALIGGFGSGKSTVGRGLSCILLGAGGAVSAPGGNIRDLHALLTTMPLTVLDNLDEVPEPFIQDGVAAAATGARVDQRRLYTNGERFSKPVTAAVVVTTRTAALFQRADLRDRCLPLFCGELARTRRLGIGTIVRDVIERRDGVLSWLATAGANVMPRLHDAPSGLGGSDHYPDFNRLVWALLANRGEQERADGILRAWRQAQQLAIADLDPLTEALVRLLPNEGLRGNASDLVRQLNGLGADLPFLGGGKAIARQLRESGPTLRAAGIRLDESTDGGGHRYFHVFRPNF